MFKKIVLKLLLRLTGADIENPGDIDPEDRAEGYIALFNNAKMMRNLQKIMIEDTKQMIKTDWSDKTASVVRAAMFARTFAIYNKALEFYQRSEEE